MERAAERLKIVVPLTLVVIFLLLYLNFRRLTETLIVMLSVPFSLVGGVWLMWALGYNFSVAVAVGFIALAGVAAETGVIMLIYLDHALDERRAEREAAGEKLTVDDLYPGSDNWRGGSSAAEDNDCGCHHGRSVANHVGHRYRIGGDEAHRRADGGRHGFFDDSYAGCYSGDLYARETAWLARSAC